MSCKIFTSLPPRRCAYALQSVVLIARPPLIVQATSRETYTFYLASRRGDVFSREEHTQRCVVSGQRIIAEWVVTSETRRCATTRHGIFSCKFNALRARRPSARGYVKSACDRFAEYRVKYEIVRPRKKCGCRRSDEIFIFQKDNKRILQFSSLLQNYTVAIFDESNLWRFSRRTHTCLRSKPYVGYSRFSSSSFHSRRLRHSRVCSVTRIKLVECKFYHKFVTTNPMY